MLRDLLPKGLELSKVPQYLEDNREKVPVVTVALAETYTSPYPYP